MKRSRGLSGALLLTLALSGAPARGAVRNGPYVQEVTPTSAVVRVELDVPAGVRVQVAAAADGGDGAPLAPVEVKAAKGFHSVRVTGLKPSTRYAYTVHVGASKSAARFTTAPPNDTSDPVRFALYGDNRTDNAAHATLIGQMAKSQADFFVQTGDLVAVGGDPAQWASFFAIEAPILRERCVFAAIGNHELHGSTGVEFARYFGAHDAPAIPDGGAPQTAHLASTFRWGSARFFLINAMIDYQTGPDRAWLEKALADADHEPGLVWRIAGLHHGPWSSGPHGENARLHRAGIVKLLQQHKVDLVVSGHDHLYERGFVDGIAYIVSGGGGAPLYRVKAAKPYSRRAESAHHFVDAKLTAASIEFKTIRADGSLVETCALGKSSGWDCDREPEPPPPAPKAAPLPAASSTGTSRCGCQAPGAAGSSHAWWIAAVGVAGLAARRRRADAGLASAP